MAGGGTVAIRDRDNFKELCRVINGALLVTGIGGGGPTSDVNITAVGGVAVGSTLPVSGTVTANQGTSPWVIGDGGGSITVDGTVAISNFPATVAVTQSTSPWVVSGTVSATQGTSPWVIGDGGGSITVDGTVAVTQGTSPWVIGDGGGSITVDGTVAVTQSTSPWVVSGTVTVSAPLNVRLQDGAGTDVQAVKLDNASAGVTPGTAIVGSVVKTPVIGGASHSVGDAASLRSDTDANLLVSGWIRDSSDVTKILNIVQDFDVANDSSTGILPIFKVVGSLPTLTDGTFSTAHITTDGKIYVETGTITVQGTISVSGLVPGNGATNLGKAEDAVHVTGDTGVMALAVRQDTATGLAANGDYHVLEVDSTGKLHVNVGTQTPGTGATNLGKAEDAVHASGDVGVMSLAVRSDTASALAANGDYIPFIVDGSGRLHVNVGNVTPGVGATDLGKAEDAVAVTGDTGVAILAVRRDSLTTLTSAEGDYANLIVDGVNRLHTVCSELIPGTAAADLGKAEDAVHTSGDVGVMSLAVRQDVLAALAGTTGDYIPLTTDDQGRLNVVKQGGAVTYRAATTAPFAAANGAAAFFVISGSSTKTVVVQRIVISGLSLTAVTYLGVVAEKWSTSAFTGGTATALTKVPLDSNSSAATTGLTQVYTAAPTEGTLVGTVASRRFVGQNNTVAAAGLTGEIVFDFRNQGENSAVVLRGTTQSLSLAFAAAPGSAVTLSLEVEWTEQT